MADYGEKYAEKAINATAKKIHGVYRKAGKELQKKMNTFLDKHKKKNAEMLAKLKNGEITQQAYDSWMRGQVFIGKQWERKIDQAANIMLDANNQAVEVVNNGKVNVFAENYNYCAYQLEKQTNGAVSFDLYDEKTVGRLIRKKPQMLPEWKIDEPKDYKWNRQKVENSITQGIIQGEGIDEITDRMVSSLCTTNENKMRTFARTAITGSQNAGRQAEMKDAEDMGIKVKKKWLATLDNRTRDTHQRLDGQTVPIDEPFVIDDMEIMFPGDPSCQYPELVYNCRCTMIEVYDGIERHSVRRDEDDNAVEDMTYQEWKEAKENGTLPTNNKLVEKPDFSQGGTQQPKQAEEPKPKEKEATEKIELADQRIKEDHEREKQIEEEIRANREELSKEFDAGKHIELEERYNDKQMRLLDQDMSRYDSISTPEEYQAKKEELAEEVRQANNDYYQRPPRPIRDDYPTEEAYEKAEQEYYENRDRSRQRHEEAERAYYDHTAYSWKDIQEAREAKDIGLDELQRQKDDIAQRKAEHNAKMKELEAKRTEIANEKRSLGTTQVIDGMESRGVEYNEPKRLETPRTSDEIISILGGGDMTEGSCASVAMCYIGQQNGWDVEDFRGGLSRSIYASGCSGQIMRAVDARAGGGLIIQMGDAGSLSTGVKVLSKAEDGAEYLFRCGCHAAIVRNNGGVMEYLELQSSTHNGWKTMGKKAAEIRDTLKYRFGADYTNKSDSIMMRTDKIAQDERLPKLFGYLNTAADKQKKGRWGHER